MTVLSAQAVFKLADDAGFSTGGHTFDDLTLHALGLNADEIKQFKKSKSATEKGIVRDDVFMTEIAFLESGYDTNAHNPKPPDNSYGLWQINMIEPLGAARRPLFGIKNNEELFDPAVNARAARKLFVANPNPLVAFHPWAGDIRKVVKSIANGTEHDGSPQTGFPNIPSPDPFSLIPDIWSTVQSIPDAIKATGQVLQSIGSGFISFFQIILDPTFWKRLGIGILGFAIILGAILYINRDTIKSTATKAGEVAAVA